MCPEGYLEPDILDTRYIRFDEKISPKFKPAVETEAFTPENQITDGAFGSPAAIFVRTEVIDSDNDGVLNGDNCLNNSNPQQEDDDGDGTGNACEDDSDEDGTIDDNDNCRMTPNPDQLDENSNGIGDVCEEGDYDYDSDGVVDNDDTCPTVPNMDQDLYPQNGKDDACDYRIVPILNSGFGVDYHWIKVNYFEDENGDTVLNNDGVSARIESIEYKTIAEFLDERAQFLERSDRADLKAAGGGPLYWPSFQERLEEMNDIRSGDVIVIMDGREGYLALDNPGDSYRGWHGGPTRSESYVPLMFSMPGTAFVKIEGGSVSESNLPAAFETGFSNGPDPIEDEYYGRSFHRNWHLSDLLQSIHTEFRN